MFHALFPHFIDAGFAQPWKAGWLAFNAVMPWKSG
jgi:hypothetical protein